MNFISSFLVNKGFTRDDRLWYWGRIVSVLLLVANNAVDLVGVGKWLGIAVTPIFAHWVTAISVVVLYFSGQYGNSPLPGGPKKE